MRIRGIFAVTRRIVWRLSYQMIRSSCRWKRIPANRRMVAIASFPAVVKARSLTFIDDVVIVGYLEACHVIGEPYRVMR